LSLEDLRSEQLGQVFTSSVVARLMVDLLVKDFNGKLILDPCVGKNIFFMVLEEKEDEIGTKFTKIGIEVDPLVVQKKWYYKKDDRTLYLQNFFDFNPPMKFDGIIMNPPYVRQEALVDSVVNSKEKIIKALGSDYSKFINKRQNLYVYFFMKAHQLLKNNGKLIAICYDSWLYTQFGELFKKFLDANFATKTVLHFEEKAFLNAEVGATVLELLRQPRSPFEDYRSEFRYTKYSCPEDYESNSPLLEMDTASLTDLMKLVRKKGDPFIFPADAFIHLSVICRGRIRRGISPKANEFFLFETPRFKETVPMVKDAKRIRGFVASQHDLRYIISLDKEEMSNELQDYLRGIKHRIVMSDRHKALRREIESGKKWYKIKLVEPGSFVLNYYLRKNVKFIYNPERYYASDNFYIFDTIIDPLLAVALLNSIFTKIGVIHNSRTQGGGLRKIQLYEFRRVPVFNPGVLERDDRLELRELGSKLVKSSYSDSFSVLEKIDQILFEVYDKLVGASVSLEDAYNLYQMKMGGPR
jgi:adenine-specific DNA-methyltransferase